MSTTGTDKPFEGCFEAHEGAVITGALVPPLWYGQKGTNAERARLHAIFSYAHVRTPESEISERAGADAKPRRSPRHPAFDSASLGGALFAICLMGSDTYIVVAVGVVFAAILLAAALGGASTKTANRKQGPYGYNGH